MMPAPMNKTEARIHAAFDLTLFLKGIHAAAELIGGVLLFFVSPSHILHIAHFFADNELAEDPHDVIANFLLHAAQSLGGSSQTFAAFYLASHGVINALVVIGLAKKKLWAYPVSIAVLAGFIIYQLYLLAFGYSFWLVLFTVLDVIIIFLVWHEYGVLRRARR